jgi:hypothetical protein
MAEVPDAPIGSIRSTGRLGKGRPRLLRDSLDAVPVAPTVRGVR